MKGEKILVTGANGFIGAALVHKLVREGNKVRCLIRKTSNLEALKDLELEYVYGDLNDKESLQMAVKGVDYVFHLAGAVKAVDLTTFIKVNAWGVINLLNAVIKVNSKLKRFLNVSSIAAGAPARSLEHPSLEEDEAGPISHYGVSKMEAEKMALLFKDKVPITTVRPATVYGPRETEMFQYFKLVDKFRMKPLVNRGQQWMNLIHVDDVVTGMIMAAESEKSLGENYYLSGEGMYNWMDITSLIEGASGKKAVLLSLPRFIATITGRINDLKMRITKKPEMLSSSKLAEGMHEYWVCSNEKAKKEIGFYPQVTAEQGIPQTYRWYKENKWL